MKEKIIIYSCMIIVSLAALIVAVTVLWQYHDEHETIIAGVIGFLGAALGGAITYMGVKMTIREQHNLINREKYEKAYYIYNKLQHKVSSINIFLNPHPSNIDFGKIFEDTKEMSNQYSKVVTEHFDLLIETEFQFISKVEKIDYHMKWIRDHIDTGGQTDQEMLNILTSINGVVQRIFNEIQEYMKDI